MSLLSKRPTNPYFWPTSLLLCLGLSVSANDQEYHFLDMSLDDILTIPLDVNSVNILESHIHKKDDWMVGYRYMSMSMSGNRIGEQSLSAADVLKDYNATPLAMSMQMHMGSLMYAPSDDLTFMAMLPYKIYSMSHTTRMGQNFTTRSEGVGDLKLMANFSGFRTRWDKHILSLKAGMSFPTGSIDERDTTPMGLNQKLPYPMQLGSGTYDILVGASYKGLTPDWGWGSQLMGTIRTGKNKHHYRLSNSLEGSLWLSRIWDNWISQSVRLQGQWWGNIHGADPQVNANMIPTANTQIRGGTRLDLLFSIDLYAPEGKLKGQHLGIEIGVPVFQYLEGPQLEMDWSISGGWQWTF